MAVNLLSDAVCLSTCSLVTIRAGIAQGIGQLFPWNVFINAEEYFSRRFCGSPFEKNFENCFTLGYNFSCILAFLLTLRSENKVQDKHQRNRFPRPKVELPLRSTNQHIRLYVPSIACWPGWRELKYYTVLQYLFFTDDEINVFRV